MREARQRLVPRWSPAKACGRTSSRQEDSGDVLCQAPVKIAARSDDGLRQPEGKQINPAGYLPSGSEDRDSLNVFSPDYCLKDTAHI
jgi:hypothetical protein